MGHVELSDGFRVLSSGPSVTLREIGETVCNVAKSYCGGNGGVIVYMSREEFDRYSSEK